MKKINYGCDLTYATCSVTEITPNPQSSLLEKECISQQDFNEDVYEQLDNIQTQADLSELGELCLTYTTVEGKLFVKNALLKLEEEICSLKEEVETLKTTAVCNLLITDCNFILGDLADTCDNPPTTLKELLQILINQHITP